MVIAHCVQGTQYAKDYIMVGILLVIMNENARHNTESMGGEETWLVGTTLCCRRSFCLCIAAICGYCRLCCCCCCSCCWWCFCKYYFVFVFLLNVNYDGYYMNECNNEAGFVCLWAQKVIYWRKRKEVRFMAIMLSYICLYMSIPSQSTYILKLKVGIYSCLVPIDTKIYRNFT